MAAGQPVQARSAKQVLELVSSGSLAVRTVGTCCLTSLDVKALISNLGPCATLQHLSLCQCNLGPQAGGLLAKVIPVTPRLLHLDLARNELGEKGGLAFANILQCSPLLHFDISENKLGINAGQALAACIVENKTLLSLACAGNDFNLTAGIKFANALQENRTLQHLDLGNHPLFGTGAHAKLETAFAAALTVNRTLQSLRLEECKFHHLGARALGAALEENDSSSLHTLSIDCAHGQRLLADQTRKISQMLKERYGAKKVLKACAFSNGDHAGLTVALVTAFTGSVLARVPVAESSMTMLSEVLPILIKQVPGSTENLVILGPDYEPMKSRDMQCLTDLFHGDYIEPPLPEELPVEPGLEQKPPGAEEREGIGGAPVHGAGGRGGYPAPETAVALQAEEEERELRVAETEAVDVQGPQACPRFDVPEPKELKSALLRLQACASDEWLKEHGLKDISSNKLSKMKYADFKAVFEDFRDNAPPEDLRRYNQAPQARLRRG